MPPVKSHILHPSGVVLLLSEQYLGTKYIRNISTTTTKITTTVQDIGKQSQINKQTFEVRYDKKNISIFKVHYYNL